MNDKKPYRNFSSGSCLEHAQVNLYVIEFWVLPILYKILYIHAIYPSKKLLNLQKKTILWYVNGRTTSLGAFRNILPLLALILV